MTPTPRYTVTCLACGWTAKTRHSEPKMPSKSHPGHKCPQCLSSNLRIDR